MLIIYEDYEEIRRHASLPFSRPGGMNLLRELFSEKFKWDSQISFLGSCRYPSFNVVSGNTPDLTLRYIIVLGQGTWRVVTNLDIQKSDYFERTGTEWLVLGLGPGG